MFIYEKYFKHYLVYKKIDVRERKEKAIQRTLEKPQIDFYPAHLPDLLAHVKLFIITFSITFWRKRKSLLLLLLLISALSCIISTFRLFPLIQFHSYIARKLLFLASHNDNVPCWSVITPNPLSKVSKKQSIGFGVSPFFNLSSKK